MLCIQRKLFEFQKGKPLCPDSIQYLQHNGTIPKHCNQEQEVEVLNEAANWLESCPHCLCEAFSLVLGK